MSVPTYISSVGWNWFLWLWALVWWIDVVKWFLRGQKKYLSYTIYILLSFVLTVLVVKGPYALISWITSWDSSSRIVRRLLVQEDTTNSLLYAQTTQTGQVARDEQQSRVDQIQLASQSSVGIMPSQCSLSTVWLTQETLYDDLEQPKVEWWERILEGMSDIIKDHLGQIKCEMN